MGKSPKKDNRQFNVPTVPGLPPRPPTGGFPPPPPGYFPPFQPPTQPPYPGPFPGEGQLPGGQGQPPQPTSPPPSFVPQQPQGGVGTLAVAPSSLRMCLYRWTYVWLSNGEQYWIWPFSIQQRTVSFYRYIPFFGYTIGGLDTRRINSFVCSTY
ncbi:MULTISPECIES: collagen-like protein [Aneurinibacillus]|jgi:hypothetical protein|uniref:collagen-like protein n=1 Tax=Aneurinibacillus TaxID=55079 RepID=UPI0011BDE8FD|nr:MULTISPECIES: collagen-like protein [Aneurinibacillus]